MRLLCFTPCRQRAACCITPTLLLCASTSPALLGRSSQAGRDKVQYGDANARPRHSIHLSQLQASHATRRRIDVVTTHVRRQEQSHQCPAWDAGTQRRRRSSGRHRVHESGDEVPVWSLAPGKRAPGPLTHYPQPTRGLCCVPSCPWHVPATVGLRFVTDHGHLVAHHRQMADLVDMPGAGTKLFPVSTYCTSQLYTRTWRDGGITDERAVAPGGVQLTRCDWTSTTP